MRARALEIFRKHFATFREQLDTLLALVLQRASAQKPAPLGAHAKDEV